MRPRVMPRTAMVGLLAVSCAAVIGSAGSGDRSARAAASGPAAAQLVGITAGRHLDHDRVVFRFAGPESPAPTARYVTGLIADPSGRRIAIAGRAILQVSLRGAAATAAPRAAIVPERLAFALPNVISAVRSGNFESVLSYGIGLAARASFRVFTLANPSRVVVDVAVPLRTTLRRVYLLNRANFSVGREPYFTAVLRAVPLTNPATGLMDRLFAGPTPAEASRSLAFLASGATGYAGLSVSGGVARIRLTGGCRSGGSSVSIAGEIGGTLKQLPGVDHVKIYDPAGRTETPRGSGDSMPACLEP